MTGAGTLDATELKPCPFCGGAAERVDIVDGENAGGSCICCTRCQASGNLEFGRKENFVSNWNRRAAPPTAGEQEKALEKAPRERIHEAKRLTYSAADAFTDQLAELGVTLPVSTTTNDIGVLFDAAGRDVLTVDSGGLREDAEAALIAGYVALAINTMGGQVPRISGMSAELSAALTDAAVEASAKGNASDADPS